MKFKVAVAFLVFTGYAQAQNKTVGDIISVDSCNRHSLQIAEMMRGKGANSENIDEFVAFIEISAYLRAYITYTERFDSLPVAMQFIVDSCKEDPTMTIGQILYNHNARVEALIRAQEEMKRRQND